MEYDAIFFDVGNTLCFYNYDFLSGFLNDRFGVQATPDELAQTHIVCKQAIVDDDLVKLGHDGLWWEVYRRWFVALGIEDELIRPISEAIRNHPFAHLFWARMEEGTREMLDHFREEGFKLGVISNAEGQIGRLIDHLGLTDRFEFVADSAIVGYAKPDARIFDLAAKKLNTEPAKCVHVGDIFAADVVGARSVGMTPILIDRDDSHGNVDCQRVRRVLDLPQLPLFTRV